ncbi:MAG: hypothetical protein HDR01_02660 [Lachnospiraceae bacterium]|nr:hypothetical protein [Lachnospiraceae bacterium]
MKYRKIKCKNCGKSFHYEECNGICKYCGRYMGMRDVEEQRKRNETDKRQKANSKWTENQKILCTFLVGIMVIVLVVSVFRTSKQAAINTASREVGIIEADAAAMQEDIFIKDGSLQILACGIVEEWKEQVPEGYELIYIEYEAKEGVRSYYTDVYLKLPQMAYVKPVREYLLSDEVGIDGDILEEEYGICGELREGNGRILFLVPEEIQKADLAIYSYGESDVEKKDSTKILQTVYEIPVDWEVE